MLRGLKPPIKGSDKVAVSVEIEKIFLECKETSYLSACILFAERYDYDIDGNAMIERPWDIM